MSEAKNLPTSPLRIVLAWGVHLFTASGAVLGAAALLAISAGEFPTAALLMLATQVIDSVDGTLARAARVSEVLPDVNGRRLDDMVDYLNFVIVPTMFMAGTGHLTGWAWCALPILSSAYGFSQEGAKTTDDFFLGWPSYWNIVALYLWQLELSPVAGTAWVVVLAIAIFVPFKYAYPSKLKQPFFRHTLNWGGLLWTALLVVAILWPAEAAEIELVRVSLLYLVYYMALSVWLGDWKSGPVWPHTSGK